MANQKHITANRNAGNADEVRKHDWSVMKPFVKFGIGALSVLGHALITIVKGSFSLLRDKPADKTNSRIIKIK